MNEKVFFEEGYKDIFVAAGLESFSDFLDFDGGQIVNKNSRRQVIKFSLDDNGTSREFFLKCFFTPQLKDIFFVCRNLGKLGTQAQLEWQTTRVLNENGVGTYKMACFGEKRSWGIERASFFVTEKIDAAELPEYVSQNWPQMNEKEKLSMLCDLGKTVKRIHTAKLSLPDLYLWHFFVTADEAGRFDFSVIDLHRAKHNITSRSERIKNLGRLYFSMSDKYFTAEHKYQLVKSYADAGYEFITEKLLHQVRSYADVIAKRRRLPKY